MTQQENKLHLKGYPHIDVDYKEHPLLGTILAVKWKEELSWQHICGQLEVAYLASIGFVTARRDNHTYMPDELHGVVSLRSSSMCVPCLLGDILGLIDFGSLEGTDNRILTRFGNYSVSVNRNLIKVHLPFIPYKWDAKFGYSHYQGGLFTAREMPTPEESSSNSWQPLWDGNDLIYTAMGRPYEVEELTSLENWESYVECSIETPFETVPGLMFSGKAIEYLEPAGYTVKPGKPLSVITVRGNGSTKKCESCTYWSKDSRGAILRCNPFPIGDVEDCKEYSQQV